MLIYLYINIIVLSLYYQTKQMEVTMELQEMKNAYVDAKHEVAVIVKKITQRENQIGRLRSKKMRIEDTSWWGDMLVKPIIENLKVKFPQIAWGDTEKLVPMGLKCRLSVFGKVNDKTVGITFVPMNLDNAEIAFENGFKSKTAPKDSIADLNGFSYNDEIITDIEQVYSFIQNQL
jgi:hypothetical protein